MSDDIRDAVPHASGVPATSLHRLRWTLTAALLLMALALTSATTWLLWRDRQEILEEAADTALFRARLFEEHAQRALDGADIATRHLIHSLLPGTLIPGTGTATQDLIAGLPQVGAVWAIAPDGRVTFSSMPSSDEHMPNLHDRLYFQTHQAAAQDAVYVGGALRSRLTSTPIFTLSRAVSDPDGTLRGVVAAGLYLSYFSDFYRSLALAPGDIVALVSADGRLILSEPPSADNGLSALQIAYPLGQDSASRNDVSQETVTAEGEPRAVARLAVEGLPLIVVSGVALSPQLTDWWTEVALLVGLLILGLAALTSLGILLQRGLKREEAARRELAAANARLTVLSQTDPLTSLANRRRFEEDLATEWRRCGRARQPLSVLMIDVDAFKAYNDTLGHHAGDIALRRVAAALIESIGRPGDLAARYGGEEMAIILPNTTLDGAEAVADTIHYHLCRVAIPHPANPVAPRLTVSIGIASRIPEVGCVPGLLVDEADEALYEAKHRGRNRTEVFSRTVRSAAE